MNAPADLLHAVERDAEAHPERVREIDANFRFDVTGEGGGSFELKLRAQTRSSGSAPDCIVQISAEDLSRWFEGATDPRRLLREGKLTLRGDLGCAVRLERLSGQR